MAEPRRALFARVQPTTVEAIDQIAKLAQLPQGTVAEALLCAELGHPHPHLTAVRGALRTWKAAQNN